MSFMVITGNYVTLSVKKKYLYVITKYRNELRMEDTSKPLWRAQNELPSLPIPTLEESCKRYLASVKALMSHEEFQNTKKAVKEFLEPGGIGETLQKRLQQRQKEQGGNNSWLQSWWNEYSYLGYREPNVIYVSYFYHFRDRVLGESLSQTRQASALVRAALEFRHLVATSTLEPDFQGRGKNRKPICSTPYKYMFNSCRIPRSGKDVFYMYPPNAPGCNSILVIRKNRFYICDVADRDGNLVSASALEKQLESIKAMADSKKGNVLPLGILTTWGRDDWTTARGQILKDGGEEFLDALQRTILCLCLDDTSPNTKEQCSRTLWHGDGKNRFFDKSVQIVVCENGVSGMIGEHSMMDGAATLNMVNWIFDYLNKHESTMFDTTRTTILTLTPTEIQPPISDKTKWNCLNAERDFANLVKKHDLRVLQFNAYGSTQIKKMKCSPDAWAQMALQLAYRMTFGQVRAVYEPVSVRQFRQGRTETVRSVTSASRSFVEAMMAKSAPHGTSDFTHQQRTRLERLRDAASLHVKNIRDSLAGRGCDRHLLGLRLLLKNGERAALFEDTSYWETCHWYISSSALSSEYLENWGFGEVVTDGIGVAYSVKKNSLSFCVTSVHGFSDSYVLNLERALLAMKSLWEDAELSLSSKL